MAGRHYSIEEWVEFEMDGMVEGEAHEYGVSTEDVEEEMHITKKLENAQERFTKNAVRVVKKWVKDHPVEAAELVESDDYESDDDIAFNTWAHFQGHGVGFWENMQREHYNSLSRAIDSDERLGKARFALENEMLNVVAGAADRASKKANPEVTIRRKGYTTKRGKYVKPARFKIKDQGRPGVRSFGAKSATGKYAHRRKMKPLITHEGTLGGPGYTKKSQATRRRILAKCVKEFGYRSCLGKVQVLLISTAIKPATRKVLEADKKWLMGKYGGPGSFGPQKGKKRSKKTTKRGSRRKNPTIGQIMRDAMK